MNEIRRLVPAGRLLGMLLLGAVAWGQNYTVPDGSVSSGTVTYDEDGTITANSYTVSGSAAVTFKAGSSIVLMPGFDATAGSASTTFRAVISTSLVVLSGQVTSNGSVVPGIVLTLSGDAFDSTTTNSNGSYSFTVPAGGTYAITPSGSGSSFAPQTAAFWNIIANATANFTAGIGNSNPFSLNSTAPAKEYIHFNGQAAVIENWH